MEENIQTPTSSKQSSPNIGVIIAVVTVIGAIAFVGLKSTKSTSTESMASPPTQAAMTQESTPAVEGTSDTAMTTDMSTKTINIEAGSFYYKPSEIRVKVGEKVKIVMTSKDMMHDFNIDELNVKIPVTKSGNTNTVEFTATKAGTFEYYCSVGEHRERGQVGKLIVE